VQRIYFGIVFRRVVPACWPSPKHLQRSVSSSEHRETRPLLLFDTPVRSGRGRSVSACRLRFVTGTTRYPDGMTNAADQSADDDDDDTDFWLAIPGFRESLIEAEADYAAGRTFS
jgi:hypothetical protein